MSVLAHISILLKPAIEPWDKLLVLAALAVVRLQGCGGGPADRPDSVLLVILDTTRAEAEFGFRSRTRLEDGLKQTIEWYESVRARFPDGGAEAGYRVWWSGVART